MTVRVLREVDAPELSDAAAVAAVEAALAHGGRPGLDVDVVLVDDPTLAELHGRFLDDPSVTDVMAFDLGPPEGGPAEGGPPGPPGPPEGAEREPEAEVYASVDRARAVAAERGVAPARELALYLVHGALHLCGHDDGDEAERARMRAAEAAVMERLGYAPER